MPSRVVGAALVATSNVRKRPRIRWPLSKTFWNSARRLSRRLLSNGRGATSEPGLTGVAIRGGTALGRGNRETLASLCPAALEDQAAILGGHAHEKSMGASPALAVWLERTFHDVRSPATVERGRRNVNNSEPRQWVSIKAARVEMVGFVTVEIVCYSRLPCGTVGSPPEVFHNCGKKCGKATVFARSSTPRA